MWGGLPACILFLGEELPACRLSLTFIISPPSQQDLSAATVSGLSLDAFSIELLKFWVVREICLFTFAILPSSCCCRAPCSGRTPYSTGNYAHIPNHLMTCSACPSDVKSHLRDLKEAHLILKHTLPKGSQKQFFNTIWERLHGYSHAEQTPSED